MINFGLRIKQLRKSKNISAKELSKKLNCDPSTISKIENNVSLPSFDLLYNICNILNYSLSEFFSEYSFQSHKIPSDVEKLLNDILFSAKFLSNEELLSIVSLFNSILSNKDHLTKQQIDHLTNFFKAFES